MSADRLFNKSAVDILDLSGAQIESWTDCATSAAVPNPFFEAACQRPAAQYLAAGHGARLVVAEHDGTLLACLPVNTVTAHLGPLRRREGHTRAIGMGIVNCLGSPLVSAESFDEAVNSLLEAMYNWSREGGPGIIVLDWIDDDQHSTGNAIRVISHSRHIPLYVRRTWERPVVRRLPDGLSLKPSMSKKFLANLNRHQRRLEEALGGPMLLVDRGDDPSAVDEFIRLEASGWKGRDGEAFANRPDAERWFRALCASYSSLGRLHMLSLEVAGRPVAMICGLRSGGSVFFFRIGHDADLDLHGPGVLVHVASVEYLGARGIDFIDPCANDDNEFLFRLYPQRRRLSTFVIATGGRIDRAAVRVLPALEPVIRASRRLAIRAEHDKLGPR